MQEHSIFGPFSKHQSFSLAIGYKINPKHCRNTQNTAETEVIKIKFMVYGKILAIQLSYVEKYLPLNFHMWRNACHEDFKLLSICMEKYDKKMLSEILYDTKYQSTWEI